MKNLAYLNKYLFKYKYRLLLGFVFVSVSNLLGFLPAQVIREAINMVSQNYVLYQTFSGLSLQKPMYDLFLSYIIAFGIIILVFALAKGVFMFFMRQTIIVFSRLVERDLKNEIYAHYQTLPLGFYRQNNTGDLMARISEDVGKVRMYLGPAIMYGINLLTATTVGITLMLAVNVELTLWVLLPLPFLSVSIYFVNFEIEKRSISIQKSLSNLSTFVQEAFSGIRVIKAFAREDDSLSKFEIATDSYKEKSLHLARVNSFFSPLIMALVGISTLLVIFVGGQKVIDGSVTPGNIAEFIIYVNQLTWPFTSLGWVSSIVQRAEVSQARINEFLNTKTEIVSIKNLQQEIKGKIKFENVGLTYPESGIQALENISFSVPEGGSIAILGSTGSGKSSLANLLCRTMDPSVGEISIDDTPLKDFNLSSLRSQMGYVPQEVFLFSDTIQNNIAFGLTQASDQEVVQASLRADLHENVLQFAEGYQTKLGERGITLSGGQKQRVSIARALIRDPKILILDDCLSAVDTKTEHTILQHLKGIMAGKTTVIISHRVSSAKLAQQILVLDQGQIIESGTHESLYAKEDGTYRLLFDQQNQKEEVLEKL